MMAARYPITRCFRHLALSVRISGGCREGARGKKRPPNSSRVTACRLRLRPPAGAGSGGGGTCISSSRSSRKRWWLSCADLAGLLRLADIERGGTGNKADTAPLSARRIGQRWAGELTHLGVGPAGAQTKPADALRCRAGSSSGLPRYAPWRWRHRSPRPGLARTGGLPLKTNRARRLATPGRSYPVQLAWKGSARCDLIPRSCLVNQVAMKR